MITQVNQMLGIHTKIIYSTQYCQVDSMLQKLEGQCANNSQDDTDEN